MARTEEELEAKLIYYNNIELFGAGLSPEEEKDLWETRAEYHKLLAQKEKDSQ